jgi:mono/diheme cytochrome c family protein
MIRRVCLSAVIAVMAVASAPGGVAASDVTEGKRIAGSWCSGCHAVGREARPGDSAPSFTQLANTILLSESYLDAWLRNPRPPMHKFQLSGDMVSNLVSYLRSLKK